MFAIHMLTATVLACCPPSECSKDSAPAAKKRTGQSEMTAVTPKAPAVAKRVRVAPGFVRLAAFDDQAGDVKVLGDEDGDAFIVSAKSAGAIPAGGPWLGLQFGPPSKPLRVQLGIEDGVGQMALNMVQGGPADTAGLSQYDIITEIDGRPVPSELDKFIDMIKTFVPGESRSLTYIRGGKQANATLSIGSRPEDVETQQYKYEVEAEALSQNQVQNFGRILEKDKDGNWVMRDLGKLENLPDDVWKLFPQGGGGFNFNFGPGAHGSNIVIEQNINGAKVRIERKDGGDITVTRTTEENGATNTTVKSYSSEDDLKASDPEAHKMLSGSKMDLGQLGRDQSLFLNRFRLAPGQLFGQDENIAKLYQQQAEQFRKQAEMYKGQNKGGNPMWMARQPRTSFELQTDGSIRVIIRDGEQELVEHFKSVDEMKNSRPELHKKYQKLQNKPAGK